MKKVMNPAKLKNKLHKQLDKQLEKILNRCVMREGIWTISLQEHYVNSKEIAETCSVTDIVVALTTGEYIVDDSHTGYSTGKA